MIADPAFRAAHQAAVSRELATKSVSLVARIRLAGGSFVQGG